MARNNEENRPMTGLMKRRLNVFVTLFIGLLTAYVGLRLVGVSIIDQDKYKTYAANQQVSTITINANRGTIYDSDMNVLASSATVWTVAVDPSRIEEEDRSRIAADLAAILDMDSQTVYEKIDQDLQYVELKKKVEKDIADELRDYVSKNEYTFLNLIEDTKRYYPQETMAAQVIGFCNSDGEGIYGIESYYDDVLSGTDGKIVTAVDGKNREIPSSYEKKYDAEDGNSVVLTIDSTIQNIVEGAMADITTASNPNGGACGIVMNVNTGEILGMANSVQFDLNDPYTLYSDLYKNKLENPTEWQYDYSTRSGEYVELDLNDEELSAYEGELIYSQWKNMATMDQYNPGSVFKVITGSSALEEGVVDGDANFVFQCTGTQQVADAIYHCDGGAVHGSEDFNAIVANSCNCAFIWMGQQLGISTFNRYLEAFGITEKTGIDLPGEGTSTVYDTEDMSIVDLASESFGQSLAVTPIQMITAVAAATNGGNLVQPYLVSEILDQDGTVISKTQPNVKRQVISEEASQDILEAMEAMVDSSSVDIEGYRIAGKSGTSQINNEENSGRYVASMVMVAPVEDPQIAVLVVVNEPTSGSYYGSKVAGPYARQIMERVLPYLGINASTDSSDTSNSMTTSVPVLSDVSLEDAQEQLANQGLSYQVYGDGDTVHQQSPAGGVSVAPGSTVILYTEADISAQKVKVPSLIGMSYYDAQQTLNALGLNISSNSDASNAYGNALIDTQSINEGEMVDVGTAITVTYSVEVIDG